MFDAVVLLPSEDGVAALAALPPARDFVADAFAHCKFIGYGPAATALFEKASVAPDEGCIALAKAKDAAAFIAACRELRLWDRELRLPA